MTTQDPYRRRPGHALVSLVEAGRDLVHGAAGARPGSRRRRNLGGIGQVSRWVGDGINWLLDDDGNAVTREAPWTEPQSPIDGRRNGGRPERMTGDASSGEPSWSGQGNDGGARRRPLQVIPHPAPPLLQQADSSPGQWQEPPSSSEPDQPFGNRDQPGSRHREGGGGRSRPRPRSSRRIKP
ncbi:MAG: hypothetical protein OXF67_08570 [Cyanobacteria bacterium MAG CAR4_bin_6]|nr:hypothetical protein [Cyanobacteria bacterium MAG CAR4_bin_6]MCY4332612.1 hypothetical protein [Cyanobacteria bacterium MAG CAR1_bin_15]